MHRVKHYGGGVVGGRGEDRRASSLDPLVFPPPLTEQQPPPQQQHPMNVSQLAIWLEKIRRRKAYRSPFSALMPATNEGESGPLEDDDGVEEDDDYDDEEENQTESRYSDAASTTPSRILSFPRGVNNSASSSGDPFRSPPESAARSNKGGGREGRVLRGGGILFDPLGEW